MAAKKLLVINPWIHDFKAYDLWMSPLGLLTVIALLKREGYEVHYLDCLNRNHEGIPSHERPPSGPSGCGKYYWEELEKPFLFRDIPRRYKRYGIPLKSFKAMLASMSQPDAVLVGSGMTYWYGGAHEAIAEVRESFPGAPVILGGLYCRLAPDHARIHSGAHHVISSGEAGSLLDILSSLTGKERVHRYDSYADLPMPAYEMIEHMEYLPLLTSTGCPWRCSYCASSLLYPHYHSRDSGEILSMLEKISSERSLDHLVLYDDAFLYRYKRHAGPLLSRMTQEGQKWKIHTPNALHGCFIDGPVASTLKKAGFKTIRLGLEFLSREMQHSTGGKVSAHAMEKAIRCLNEAGFSPRDIGVYVMAGVPGVMSAEIREALLAVHRWGALGKLVEYSPIPGTGLWNDFPGTGSPEAWDPLFHNNTFHTYRGTVLPFGEFEELRQLCLALNRKLA
ncbi:MAG: radical SAM protein [Candidatus Eremiobacteraeota bacterium]|nr:radical SAM protein [Candidatus Eremiobacteraeota bacterium]